MMIKRRITSDGRLETLVSKGSSSDWTASGENDQLGFVPAFSEPWEVAHAERLGVASGAPWLPFAPLSIRDFSLSEKHNIDAARGLVARFAPGLSTLTAIVERISRRPFPAFRPGKLWHSQPLYYLNNPLTVVPSGTPISFPPYSEALDYEVQLGLVLNRPIKNATLVDAEAAIGGFVVFCDFTARDKQLAEMRSGFGVQKAKHFIGSMSDTAVTPEMILPNWNKLAATVLINGEVVAHPTMADARWSLSELLVHASAGEQLEAGEMISMGCFAGGSGVEIGRWLQRGDHLEIRIDGIGVAEHLIT